MTIENKELLLKVNEISVRREKRDILNKVSFDMREQDFTTIIGPNGAGKSMLLRCIIGFLKPTAGVIQKKNNLRIGYMPQRFLPDNSMPINAQRFLSLRKKTQKNVLIEIIDETHVENLLSKPLHVLSGGEMQRLLLARALLNNPELLILDEPAQNLDFSGQLAFYTLLEKIISKRKLGVLMVSHDLHMVMASTQKVICLFHHICCSGPPQTIAQDPEFLSLFGKDMAKTISIYQHKHDHRHG